jgi:RimJ/RimL family protein N-acetyltransferase
MTRILPTSVSREQQRAFAMPVVDLGFRPMTEDDFTAVARWQSAAHVAPWWDARSRDEESVRTRYAARLRGEEPTRMWVVEIDGRAVGYLQDYRVRDHPDYAVKTRDPDAVGFDYVIGEGDLVNRGLGTRMIWEFCRDVLHRDYPDADHLLASPSHRNVRSLRALAKCGFTQGLWIDAVGPPGEPPDTEIVCTLDVRHWLG